MKPGLLRALVAVAALSVPFILNVHLNAQFSGAPSPNSAFSIPQAQLLQPDELYKLLQAKGAQKPLLLQVGSHVLFAQAHIPGSEYAGAGSQPAGLQQLQSRVSMLPRNTFIVLYCGCCPWNRCPNVGPAFKLLHDLGFTRVKVLNLAENLGADWADKGYPVERGN
jgi:rhodanese-related sulfurtransferase